MIPTLALLALITPAQDAEPAGPFPSVIERVRLDTWAELLLETDELPGFAVGMLRGDQRWLGGYGETALGNGKTPNALTRYEIGSLTKLFTGILLAEMALKGDVRIDQPVDDLLPDGLVAPASGDHRIQLVHLATHTSGMPRLPGNLDLAVDPERPYENYTSESLVSALAETKLTSIPGRLYAYSNYGYGLLGTLLASSQQLGYERLLAARVLGPLGLFHTTLTRNAESEARMAPPYAAGLRPVAPWLFRVMAPCGALVSSTTDMLALLEAQLGKAPASMIPALDLAASQIWTNPATPMDMGLGWHRNRRNGSLFHSGQTGGYYSFIALDIEREIGVVVLTNSSTSLIEDWGQRAFQLLRGDSYIEAMHYRAQKPRPASELNGLVGDYGMLGLGTMKITQVEGRLFAQLGTQDSYRLYADAEKDDLFFYRSVDAELRFDRDSTPQRVTLLQSGREFTGTLSDGR